MRRGCWSAEINGDLVFPTAVTTPVANPGKLLLSYKSYCTLFRWAYKEAGWSRIACLAPAVLECAEDGDLVAFKIVTTAADEAVRAVEAVVSKAKLKGHRFKMVLSGVKS